MGSPCQFQLYTKDDHQHQQVFSLLKFDLFLLESRYSRYLEDSILSGINRIAEAGGSVRVDDEVAKLLNYADVCYRESGGLFDITTGILRKAWDFKTGRLPDPALIKEILEKVGWNKVKWQPPHLNFSIPGMELDFGGIVKEYAADRCATLCLDHGVQHGLINLGGDIRVIGPHPCGEPWNIGIENPFNPEVNMLDIQLKEGGLASSGDYARCIEIDGKIYSHILNPRTGWPTEGLRAVSVVTDQCVTSGSVSTIAMLKGKQGKKWLKKMGVDYVCMDAEGKMSGTLLC